MLLKYNCGIFAIVRELRLMFFNYSRENKCHPPTIGNRNLLGNIKIKSVTVLNAEKSLPANGLENEFVQNVNRQLNGAQALESPLLNNLFNT